MAMELRERDEPHWVWLLGSLIAPLTLLAVSLAGMGRGSLISTGVAVTVPNVALLTSAVVAGVALFRGRRLPILITLIGCALTAAGFFWLRWVG